MVHFKVQYDMYYYSWKWNRVGGHKDGQNFMIPIFYDDLNIQIDTEILVFDFARLVSSIGKY